MSARIDIAMGFDAKYAPHAATVVSSIVHNAPGAQVRFLMLHADVDAATQNRVAAEAPQAEFVWIEVGESDLPAYATRGGRPWLSFGVMGGAFQPTGHVFVLTSMVEHGLDPQEAIDLPRIFFEGGETLVEETVPAHVLSALEGMGHQLRTREAPWGGGQMVMMDHASGVLVGASDARKDGCALGW